MGYFKWSIVAALAVAAIVFFAIGRGVASLALLVVAIVVGLIPVKTTITVRTTERKAPDGTPERITERTEDRRAVIRRPPES